MLAYLKDRFSSDCRRELVQLHTTLKQELLAASGSEKKQAALLVELRACEEAYKTD